MTRKLVNDVWVTELQSPDGATATIADHGAHLLSWQPSAGQEMLYMSERSKYGAGNAIRGGVPIIFPQFGERGNGKRHGFARVMNWQQQFAGVEGERAVARFSLTGEGAATSGWSHRFALLYEVAFTAKELQMTLTVHNTGDVAWEFNAALHTYLHVADIGTVDIAGLQHNEFIDQPKGGIVAKQDDAALTIGEEIDRIYLGVHKPLILSDKLRTLSIRKHGFEDVVVWNPWKEKAAQLSDMSPEDFRAFVCVEAGAVAQPIVLQAGEKWQGTQSIAPGKARP